MHWMALHPGRHRRVDISMTFSYSLLTSVSNR